MEVGGRVETIQTTALLRTARILRRVLETYYQSNSSEKPSVKIDVKNSKGVNDNNWIQQISTERVWDTHDWVGKLICWNLCKILKFDHTNKWYVHKPASILENETHKLFWYFEIQTGHQITARRPDLIITHNKIENLPNFGLYCPGLLQSKIERKRIEQ